MLSGDVFGPHFLTHVLGNVPVNDGPKRTGGMRIIIAYPESYNICIHYDVYILYIYIYIYIYIRFSLAISKNTVCCHTFIKKILSNSYSNFYNSFII